MAIESHPLFVVNGVDWTNYITVPNYAVNLKPVYDEWVDANRTTHRDVVCYKLEGTFTVKCPNLQTYYNLMDSLYAKEDEYGGFYVVDGVYANNNQEYVNDTGGIELFVEFEELQNGEPIMGMEEYEGFEVTVKER